MWQENTSEASWRWLMRFMSACKHTRMYSQTPTDCMHVARKYFLGNLMMVDDIYERMRAHWQMLTITHWLCACGKETLLGYLDDGFMRFIRITRASTLTYVCKHPLTICMWLENASWLSFWWLIRSMSACEHTDMYSQSPTDCMHVARKYFWGILMMVNEIHAL